MTVSTSRNAEPTVDQIVHRSYQQAGLMESQESLTGVGSAEKIGMAHFMLDTLLKELQTEGIFAKPMIFREVTVSDGTNIYPMQTDILDLVGDAMYIDNTNTNTAQADGETVIKQIDREAWQRLSSKAAKGRPNLYYVHRASVPLDVYLWPIPDETATIRFQMHQLLADTFEGTATIDLRQYWLEYVIFQMAHKIALANGLPVQRCGYLKSVAKDFRNKARGYANQRPNDYMQVNHSTPWSAVRRR